MHSQTDCKCDCMPAAVCTPISFRLYIQPSTALTKPLQCADDYDGAGELFRQTIAVSATKQMMLRGVRVSARHTLVNCFCALLSSVGNDIAQDHYMFLQASRRQTTCEEAT